MRTSALVVRRGREPIDRQGSQTNQLRRSVISPIIAGSAAVELVNGRGAAVDTSDVEAEGAPADIVGVDHRERPVSSKGNRSLGYHNRYFR